MKTLIFPKWVNKLLPAVGGVLLVSPLLGLGFVAFVASPKTTDVGYSPEQPVEFSHDLHAGDLGLDCRYCHTTVEKAAHAAVPSTAICMNCHKNILPESKKLLKVRESHATGKPVEWVRVHDLPDYVYFDHSAHINKGVSCVFCHGRVDRMERVHQVETLSMGWCLDCHRDPEPHLRPKELVTDLEWKSPESPEILGKRLKDAYNVKPSTDCSTCHR